MGLELYFFYQFSGFVLQEEQDEMKEIQGSVEELDRAEHSHGQSSCCAREKPISYTANKGQGFAKAI